VNAGKIAPSTIGRAAARADGVLTVFARFNRSAYARDVQDRIVCIVAHDLGDGPLHAVIPGDFPDLPDTIELAPAPIWAPPGLPAWTEQTLVSGLARAVAARPDGAWRPSFIKGLEVLGGWVRGQGTLDACRDLIGLGPGLTPSGDDALGGAAIALRAFGHVARADELGAFIRTNAPGRTGDISLAHLLAAAEGEGSAAFHAALTALVTNGDFAMLDKIGASSGWDAMDGVAAVLSPSAGR
jgi:hypothetical protein